MSLRLVLETNPHPQQRAEARLGDGRLVIGRSEDCDWQLDDPQMFISRRHCVVVGQGGEYRVTDHSSGGLFLDGSAAPLGQGNTAALSPGMRLRLGDFVIRVESEDGAQPAEPVAGESAMFDDGFFAPQPEPPRPPRPADLPDPFGAPEVGGDQPAATGRQHQAAPMFDDPFTMEYGPRPVAPAADREPRPGQNPGFDFGDFGMTADTPAAAEPMASAPCEPEVRAGPAGSPGAWPPAAPVAPLAERPDGPLADPPQSDAGAAAALLKGMGLAPPPGFSARPEELEAIGRRYRAMAEGLVRLLRSRAQEKGAARVAQTVIGAANVNPLKFLAGGDEIVAALIAPRGPGYLDPDAAIADTISDLLDHNQRNWVGLQAALRRMIDRFDPAEFEAEVEEVGMLKAIVTGGRAARLWQLYSDRYRTTARAAEDRFLGEVGADFRQAYEGGTGRTDDGTA